jgi:hypothetical protein
MSPIYPKGNMVIKAQAMVCSPGNYTEKICNNAQKVEFVSRKKTKPL